MAINRPRSSKPRVAWCRTCEARDRLIIQNRCVVCRQPVAVVVPR